MGSGGAQHVAPLSPMQTVQTIGGTQIVGKGGNRNYTVSQDGIVQVQYYDQSAQQLQGDLNDPTKWQVVAATPAQINAAIAAGATVTTSSNVSHPSTPQPQSNQSSQSTSTDSQSLSTEVTITPTNSNNNGSNNNVTRRVRRVACTCPYCRDGEGK